MSSLSQFFGGSGGGANFKQHEVIEASQTWSAPVTGTVRVTVVGGGGAGGYYMGGPAYCVYGGSAGGTAIKTFDVTEGDNFTVTIGAGGPFNVYTGAGARVGDSGGTTTFTNGTTITMTATGGGGGGYVSGSTTSSAAAGTGSGGDFNYTGGKGGYNTISTGYAATGGGGVNLFGLNDCDGGVVSASQTLSSTGGGSPYGHGGAYTGAYPATSGAGLQGSGNSDGSSVGGLKVYTSTTDVLIPFPLLTTSSNLVNIGYSRDAQYTYSVGIGGSGSFAGGSSITMNSSSDSYYVRGGSGGAFGGGGGCCAWGQSVTDGYGGNGGYGAGGGGYKSHSTYSPDGCGGGAGGDGVVIIEYGVE